MFRPKEPFEGQETIETHLIEPGSDGVSNLSAQCVKFAKERPDDFMNYLRHAWEHDGPSVLQSKDVLRALKSLGVAPVKKNKAPLEGSYLPLPKLVYIRNRYLLPNEGFPFLQLEPDIASNTDLGPWAFLRDDLSIGSKDNLAFYLALLTYLRRENKEGTVDFPRRVLELYLRIHAVCEDSQDVKGCCKRTRTWFVEFSLVLSETGWTVPSKCYVKAPRELASATSTATLLPPPKEWEASNFELTALEKFYRETLEITDGSFATVIDELDKQEADVARAKQLYHALDALRPELSKKDVSRLKSFFKENRRIVLSDNDPSWYWSTECIWAPKLISPDLTNPSELYPELESFFVDLLGVPKIDIGVVYNDLINFSTRIMLDPSDPPEEHAKRLLVALSQEIDEYGHLLDKEKLLQCEVFPVVGTDGKVRLCSSSTTFLIADREYLYDGFWRKMDLLDVTPTTAWLLGPFITWANLADRYLSKNVEMTGRWYCKAMDPETTPYIHPSRAFGLLRIAVHFKSPRAATPTDRMFLARTLKKTRIYYLGKEARTATLSMNRTGIASVESHNPLSGVGIRYDDDDDDGLHISMDSKLTEVASAVLLPRQLTAWLMRNPETGAIKSLDERIIGLVRTIMRVNHQNLPSIKWILDAEGIVNVDELNQSPYIPQKKEEKPLRLFGAEPSPPASDTRKSTPLPVVPQIKPAASTSPQVNDLTQKVWALNLQPKLDTSKTTDNPDWIKFF